MALVLNDRVKETTTTTGTGAVTLAGAVSSFETFAAGVGNSNTTYYAIVHQTANEFEVGLGTLNGDSSTITEQQLYPALTVILLSTFLQEQKMYSVRFLQVKQWIWYLPHKVMCRMRLQQTHLHV